MNTINRSRIGDENVAPKTAAVMLPWLALGCLLLTTSCQKEAALEAPATLPLPQNAVAKVGDAIIGLEQYEAALREWRWRNPKLQASMAEKRSVLEELVRTEVLHERAKAEGYQTNAEIVATLKRLMIRKFQEEQLPDPASLRVTDDEILAYYQNHPEEFRIPEQRQGAVIFMRVPTTASKEKAQERRDAMEAIRSEAIHEQESGSARTGFGVLAQKHSEDQATRYRGGQMGWLTSDESQDRWETPVVQALFALREPGQISPVIATGHGLYLVKAMEIRSAALKPIEKVRDGIAYHLGRQKAQEAEQAFYAEQRAQVNIELNLALLETVPSPAPPTATPPPATPGT